VLFQSICSIAQSLPGLLRSPWLVRQILFLPVLPALSLIASACSKREAAPNPEPALQIARGDEVVVEKTAAHFFQGRVLATEGGLLHVQAADGTDALSVPAGDVYRLPPPARTLTPGAFAICGRSGAWIACRIEHADDTTVSALDAAGVEIELTPASVILPSPLSELNLKRYFARHEAELDFARSAANAGDPRPEPGWHPALRERLLARLGADWFTAYVKELGDDGAVVALSAAQKTATVPLSALAAEPPSSFAAELHRGDFVLTRPDSQSEPWLRRQVRATNGPELKLSDAAGAVKSALARDVVPLGQ
jgi:hypothetical protein